MKVWLNSIGKNCPTTSYPGVMTVVLSSKRDKSTWPKTSGQRPGESSKYKWASQSFSSSESDKAANKARLPPLEWPHRKNGVPKAANSFAYSAAFFWADTFWKESCASSFHPTIVSSVPRKPKATVPLGKVYVDAENCMESDSSVMSS